MPPAVPLFLAGRLQKQGMVMILGKLHDLPARARCYDLPDTDTKSRVARLQALLQVQNQKATQGIVLEREGELLFSKARHGNWSSTMGQVH